LFPYLPIERFYRPAVAGDSGSGQNRKLVIDILWLLHEINPGTFTGQPVIGWGSCRRENLPPVRMGIMSIEIIENQIGRFLASEAPEVMSIKKP